jgi:leucyl/phenylalanyl-tRNA--protein transferase
MGKILKTGIFTITFNRDFEAVIRGCAGMYRPDQEGTWITTDIIDAFIEMHRLGWAISAEAYLGDKLVGGCYGIRFAKAFFGESMFAIKPNASKAAFLSLAQMLFADGVQFIDCQIPSNHLRSLGGEELSRSKFLSLLHFSDKLS